MEKIKQARNKAIEAHASITMGEHTIAHVLLGDVVNLLSELVGSQPKELTDEEIEQWWGNTHRTMGHMPRTDFEVVAILRWFAGSFQPKEQGAEPVAWMTMDTCPTDRRVLLMHPDVTGEMRCCCWRTGDGFEPEDIGALGWAEFGRTTRTPATPTSRERAMEEAGEEVIKAYRGFHEAIEQHTGKPYPWDPMVSAIEKWTTAKSTK